MCGIEQLLVTKIRVGRVHTAVLKAIASTPARLQIVHHIGGECMCRSEFGIDAPPRRPSLLMRNMNVAFDKGKITTIAESSAVLFDPTASALESARLSSRIRLNAGGQRRPTGRSCRRA
jgi:hypothetical protein